MSSHLVCAEYSVDLPSYPSSAASFFKSKGLDLLPPLYENLDCPFAFHIPFSVLLYTSWDGDLHFVLSKEFSVLSLFFKLSGIIPWRHQLSLACMCCFLSQLELAIFSPMCIALYLFELKFIFHFNTVTPVRSFCDCLQSATLVTTLKNLVASANLVMSLFTSYSRFLMNMLRSMCPSTDPAGILQVCNKLPLWKMTRYCYLIYLQIFYFFLVFKSVVHPCQSLYSSSAGSHSFVLVFVWIKLHTWWYVAGDQCCNLLHCIFVLSPSYISSLPSSLFSCAELKIQVFMVSFWCRT